MTETAHKGFSECAKFIQEQLAEQAYPSLAVAVAKEGHILWEQGFGWANRESRIRATEHTAYSLASISKPITTTALMLLQQRGRLELDRPINDYLGEAKLKAPVGDVEGATLRRVANHTSGLPLHYQFFYADEPYRRPEMDETIRRYATLVRAPGERYQYSNLGYGLLDYVISRASGHSYADFMREEIFLPLGMLRSSVDIPPAIQPYAAARYGSDGIPYPFYDFDHPGGSAIFCSAHDLIRFGMLHLGTRLPDQKALLSEQTLEAMQVNTSAPEEKNGYGIGWGVNADNLGYRSISHTGGMGGVNTLLMLIPSEKIVVAALGNACGSLPFRACEEILASLLPEYDVRLRQRQAEREKEQKKGAKTKKPAAFKPGKRLSGEWNGELVTWNGPIPLMLWFKSSGDVHAQLGNQLRALVNDVKFDDDQLRGVMLGDIETEDANRRPYRLHLDLKLRDETLNGAIIAITHMEVDQGGARGRRTGNALSHWAELKRA